MIRRLCAAALLAFALVTVGASAASAAPIPIPNPANPGKSLSNPVTDVGKAIIDKLCPPRVAPYPQTPEPIVVRRGGGPGGYATYGYAGLTWTTYDAGCLSTDKADTAIGSQINTVANGIDQLTNELQVMALSDGATDSLDSVIVTAIEGLRRAFFNPWVGSALALVGVIMLVNMLAGRVSAGFSAALGAVLVIGALTVVFTHPRLIPETANKATTGVAAATADSLTRAVPDRGSMPASSTPSQRFAEGFYSVSLRAWQEGWACGDEDAMRRYTGELRSAQAFTVAQVKAGVTQDMVDAKAKRWLDVGSAWLRRTRPLSGAGRALARRG